MCNSGEAQGYFPHKRMDNFGYMAMLWPYGVKTMKKLSNHGNDLDPICVDEGKMKFVLRILGLNWLIKNRHNKHCVGWGPPKFGPILVRAEAICTFIGPVELEETRIYLAMALLLLLLEPLFRCPDTKRSHSPGGKLIFSPFRYPSQGPKMGLGENL